MKSTKHRTTHTLLILLSLTLLIGSCSPRTYKSSDFKQQFSENSTVAILPYKVQFNGKMPKGLTEEQRLKQDHEERIGFQQSLFSYFAGKARREPVRILPIQQTNAKLSDLGFDIYNIEKYAPQNLVKTLGVNAILTPSVEKTKLRWRLTQSARSFQ